MSQQVLNGGIDPTSINPITGAQLLQLVAAATFATGVGGILSTTDDNSGNPSVPNPGSDSTLATWMWLRIGNAAIAGATITPYFWNPNASSIPTYLKWQTLISAGIGPGSIIGSMIAASTIDKTKISGQLDPTQVAGLSPLTQFLSVSSIFGTPTGQTYDQVPYLVGGSLTWTMQNVSSVSKLVSRAYASTVAAQNQTTNNMGADTQAGFTTVGIAGLQKAALTVTTGSMSSSNRVNIEVILSLTLAALNPGWVGLYDTTAGAFLAYTRIDAAASIISGPAIIKYEGAIPASGIRTYDVYFGSTSATAGNMTVSAKASELSSITVQEIRP